MNILAAMDDPKVLGRHFRDPDAWFRVAGIPGRVVRPTPRRVRTPTVPAMHRPTQTFPGWSA